MTFKEYQEFAKKTAIYPRENHDNLLYPTLGLVSEAGEVAGKLKKIIRDDHWKIDEAKKQDLAKEIGDVLWYVAQLSTELELSLEEIAQLNLKKLEDRYKRGQITGSGDNR